MSKPDINRMFRAFSDGTRLRILHVLLTGELCVGDIVAILKVPQPATSRHLNYLKRAGLVIARKAGLWIYYALLPARSPFHRRLLQCLESCFNEVPALRMDKLKVKKIRRIGGCCRK